MSTPQTAAPSAMSSIGALLFLIFIAVMIATAFQQSSDRNYREQTSHNGCTWVGNDITGWHQECTP